MKAIMQPLAGLAEFQEIRKSLYASPGIQLVTGCTQSQKMHFAAGLTQDSPVRLIIAENDLKAKELYEDYKVYDFFSGGYSGQPADKAADACRPRFDGTQRSDSDYEHRRMYGPSAASGIYQRAGAASEE